MNAWLSSIDSRCSYLVSQLWAFMFVVHTSNCHGQNCTRRAIFGLNWHVNCQHSSFLIFSFIGHALDEAAAIPSAFERTLIYRIVSYRIKTLYKYWISIIAIRSHRLHAVHWSGLPLRMSHVAWYVCMSVRWPRGWAVQRWLNRSRCRLIGDWLVWVQRTMS